MGFGEGEEKAFLQKSFSSPPPHYPVTLPPYFSGYAALPFAFGPDLRIGATRQKEGQQARAAEEFFHALPTSDSSVDWAEVRCTSLAPTGTSFVTQTLPPMIAPLPMVMRPRMVAPA